MYTVDITAYQRTRFANMAGGTTFSLKEKENVSTLQNQCLLISPKNPDAVLFLPEVQTARPGLSLPAGLLVPETEQWLSIWMTYTSLCIQCSADELSYVLPTCGPGAPIPPGVPDLPCETQRNRYKKV